MSDKVSSADLESANSLKNSAFYSAFTGSQLQTLQSLSQRVIAPKGTVLVTVGTCHIPVVRKSFSSLHSLHWPAYRPCTRSSLFVGILIIRKRVFLGFGVRALCFVVHLAIPHFPIYRALISLCLSSFMSKLF